MALFGALASTVGILVLISLTSGQMVGGSDTACSPADMERGLKCDQKYPQVYETCSSGNNQVVMMCGEGTICDNSTGTCNHISQSKSIAAPCSSSLAGKTYPSTCCEDYFYCNGVYLEKRKCPPGQSYNAQSGTCGQFGGCTDHEKCVRYRTPSGPQAPCPLRADPSSPCVYRMQDNETLGPIQSCPEGTGYNMSYCACVRNDNCMRSANSSGAKTPDPECRASFVLNFTNVAKNPEVYSEKTQRITNQYVETVGLQYGNEQATLSSNPASNAPAYLYCPAFSNNHVSSAFVKEITFRLTIQGTFVLITNNHNGACAPTFSFNVTSNGAGTYQLFGFITGATDVGTTTLTNVFTLPQPIGIQVGPTDFVLARIVFAPDRLRFQMINKGQSGTVTQGQPMNAEYPGIGDYILPNDCGFQMCYGLTGFVKIIKLREACLNIERARD